MKRNYSERSLLILSFLLFTIQICAQNEPTESKAKLEINGFQEQLNVGNEALDKGFYTSAKSKITTLERLIGRIKTRDPQYNTSPLEAQLETFKTRYSEESSASEAKKAADTDRFGKNVETQNKLDIVTRTKSLSEEESTELLGLDISTINLERYVESVEEYATSAQKEDLPRLKSLMTDVPIVQEALIHYEKFENQKRYWKTVATLFPASSLIKETSNKFEELDKEVGGEEGVKTTSKSQYGDYIKSKKMPPAVVKDTQAENIIIKVYEEEGKKQGYDRKLVKINLLESDWTILTNKYTSVIVGRKRSAAIVFKNNKTGECTMYRFFEVYQQYNGSGYSNGEGTSTTEELIPCENVK